MEPSDSEVWKHARIGDLEMVRYLVEVDGADVNYVNEWNATALFYAAHGGHLEVVEYLLDNGALCEDHTFQGERCFYGALNDRIRDVLRHHKLTRSMRHPFREHWRKLWVSRRYCDFAFIPSSSDLSSSIALEEEDEVVDCHKLVLYVRCPKLRNLLLTSEQWKKNQMTRKCSKVPLRPLNCLLMFLYTGKMEVARSDIQATAKLLSAFELEHARDILLNESEGESEGRVMDRNDHDSKVHRGGRVKKIVSVEEDTKRFQDDWRRFVSEELLRFRIVEGGVLCNQDCFADVCVRIDDVQVSDSSGLSINDGHMPTVFYLHRFILEAQSDYFKAMFNSPLFLNKQKATVGDGSVSTGAQERIEVTLQGVSRHAFATVVGYMYGHLASDLGQENEDEDEVDGYAEADKDAGVDADLRHSSLDGYITRALEVLDCAERMMLPGLKTLVGAALKKLLSVSPYSSSLPSQGNGTEIDSCDTPSPAVGEGSAYVFELLEASRKFSVPALEDSCHSVVAAVLPDILGSEEGRRRLEELIVEDANSVKGRQAEDSIPIVDELSTAIKTLFKGQAKLARDYRESRIQQLREVVAGLGFAIVYVEEDGDGDGDEMYE